MSSNGSTLLPLSTTFATLQKSGGLEPRSTSRIMGLRWSVVVGGPISRVSPLIGGVSQPYTQVLSFSVGSAGPSS